MKDILSYFEKPKDPLSFKAIRISIASPEVIREEWSHGEVKKSETINYRTFKPERDGLFCARIFGPVKDYECNCGKYKRMKHRGIVCEKCGVEVIQSKVRRERLGHINLAVPVAHIWFLRSLPSKIGAILDMTIKQLERVLYCEAYAVIDPGRVKELNKGDIISEEKYEELLEKYGEDAFVAKMGGEAIRDLLASIDIHALAEQLRKEMNETTSEAKKKKIAKRFKIVEAFRKSGNKPEHMILTVIPVLPPDLRPLVPLEGGRFATSDLNELYRRVINRNNRLKRLLELNAPDIIIRNEKRMLQEAVDALFDNGRRGRAVQGSNRRVLKSLSDMLRGKQGRYRQNLLGKRVDYSGRSVIVVGPNLKLHQCGLPKQMAIELFKPFIYHKLQEKGYVTTIKNAKKLVEKGKPEVWDALEEVIKEHPILLNRAPTLHRLGIQAFEPVLTEGKAIQLHPLVCTAYNADFDGDQMAVHIPLSIEAQMESRVLVMSTNNILGPAHGKPIVNPTQDIVLGLYYITRERPFVKGEYKESKDGILRGVFANPQEVRMAYDAGAVDIHAKIKVRINGNIYTTTVGRVLVYEVVPKELPFSLVNKVLDKKALSELIDECYRRCGNKATVIMVDQLRSLGFEYATKAGISICIDDMIVPSTKEKILRETEEKVNDIISQYQEGIITEGERYNQIVDEWTKCADRIANDMFEEMGNEIVEDEETGEKRRVPSFNPLYIMADSGARGSKLQLRQLAGMRGNMAKPSGEIIETPIKSNFREGLTVLEYFISTHGARKGLADTALKTANSGYLTRKLIDVAQECTVKEFDCGTLEGIEVTALEEGGEIIEKLSERIIGRYALEDIYDPLTGEVLVRANEEIDEEAVIRIEEAGINKVKVRSPLTCQTPGSHVCVKCYGRDLARGYPVNIGEAVGIIAAQSIGEPGTQLTMRTFHTGGTAARGKIEQSTHVAQGKGKVKFRNIRYVRKKDGTVVVMSRRGELIIEDQTGRERERYPVIYGARLKVEEGQEVDKGTLLAEWDAYSNLILTEVSGIVRFEDIVEGVTMEEQVDETTGLSTKVIIESRDIEMRPRIEIKDPKDPEKTLTIGYGEHEASYPLPIKSIITVSEGQFVEAGDVIAKIPRETTKTKDITGGLPRVTELFEARKPKDYAIISEIDGRIELGKEERGKRKVIVIPEIGEPKEYLIPEGKHLIVRPGDWVKAGEPLMDGPANPHDILRILGEKALAQYLVDRIQEVYRLQGVSIHDKHIEIIVRQMLRRVRIKDPGDTNFIYDEQVEKHIFERENEKIIRKGGRPAVAAPLLLGIAKAALSSESFLSAASFQETTRVLADAAVAGKIDFLKGLKENVIMGRLIPAGTGIEVYRELDIVVEESEELTREAPPEDLDTKEEALNRVREGL